MGSLILITSLSPLTTLLCFTPCGFFNSDRFTFSTHHVIIILPLCGFFNSDRFTFSTHHGIMSLPLCGFFNSDRFTFSTHHVVMFLPLCGFFHSDRFTFSTHHRGAVPGTNWLHGGEHSAVWTSSDPVKDYDSRLVHAQVPFY